MSYLVLSKQWRLEQRGDELYILGGQDAVFSIELEAGGTSFFSSLKHGHKFTAKKLPPADRVILEQLLSAGVITPVLPVKKAKQPVLKLSGAKQFAAPASYRTTTGNDYDLLVLIRTKGMLRDFLSKQHYLDITKPHIFVDLAYNHTISIGPLVFPGDTSCLACLEGRLSTRWDDAAPPPRSKAASSLADLARQWLAVELDKIFTDQDYSLVNKTVFIDTQNRSVEVNKLLTVPLCPYCKKSRLLPSGKLEYTFAKG